MLFVVISQTLTVLSVAVFASARAPEPPWIATGANGMVASDSLYASQAGVEILKDGGNAVDAAVAVSFALAVTRPYSTGLGGGGFMILRFADGRVVVQDFRETAPSAATPDMYLESSDEQKPPAPPASEIGHRAVAVPGLIAGRCQALQQFGTMSLTKVTAPAIKLANSGFPVDQHYVDAAREVLSTYERHPKLKEVCPYVYRTHLREGKLPSAGDMLVQPELARLLVEIAGHGPDIFYRGPVAEAIEREMKRHGGLVTAKDLADYSVKMREPIISTYRDYTLILMPPCSSGGVALAETLNILETFDLPGIFRQDPALATHYQIEAMKHAFADRARRLGDADFVRIPIGHLTSKAYAKTLAGRLDPQKCREVDTYGLANVPDDTGTSHFSIADRFGNVVVSTETINTTFGSLAAIDEWGLILNNEMDDFTANPGKPNAFGLIQSDRNAVGPGRRPLSCMSPTIVLKDGKPHLLIGASGGPRIITSVLNVLLSVTDYGMSLGEAMQSRRPHHQWLPEEVFFDAAPPETIKLGLLSRGHKVSDTRRTGIVQAIQRTNDGWLGASDPRKGGRPAGY
jgi:gamma-glutamyltranspeptidase/glutathione hydrolase